VLKTDALWVSGDCEIVKIYL